jgi:enoyl-CoA hydratase/carnithine racemase
MEKPMKQRYETLEYREENGVAWVTLNRPDVLNAFNTVMLSELRSIWQGLRSTRTVRCIVLTGAGDRAFCTGIDRNDFPADTGKMNSLSNKLHTDDLGLSLGPKTNDLWIPVIAAVNGIACGGAFYMLGECDFIIASETATFFDPHVTTGLAAVYESIHMLQKMPFHEIMRIALMGSHERMSARRAYEVGLVSELTAPQDLAERARWAAEAIASQPALAVQGSVRALWLARQVGTLQALAAGPLLLGIANDPANVEQGQAMFKNGHRPKWRLR